MEQQSAPSLMQYKQDLIKAVKAAQYDAALAIVQQALALAPDDALLRDFNTTLQAKVQQQEDSSSEEEGDEGDEAQTEEDDDSNADEGDEQQESSSGEEHDDASSTSSSGPDECDSCWTIRAAQPNDQAAGTAAAVAAAAADSAQDASKEVPASSSSQQVLPDVCSIKLEATCCTLTHTRRAELKQQIVAAIDQQKETLLEQKMLQDDPLLAA